MKKLFNGRNEVIKKLASLLTDKRTCAHVCIFGYTFVHSDSSTTAGGDAMYTSIALQFSVLTNLQLTVNECENIWIKLHDSNIIISTIYRHPKIMHKYILMH